MMRLGFILVIYLLGCCLNPVHSKTSDLFESGPGQSKVYLGNEINLVWSLTRPVDLAEVGTRMNIINSGGDEILIFLSPDGCNNKGNNRLSCITQSTSVGFSIKGAGVQQTDAGPYRCNVKPSPGEGEQKNEDASIYIYRAPSTHTITGNNPSVAGVSLTLQCSATPWSLPLNESASAVIEYTWSTSLPDTSLSGNPVTVGPLTRNHDGKTVKCTAKEQGSNLTSEKTVTISVIYPPRSAQLQANKATVVEEIDDLAMTCQLPAGEEGNPNTYTYQWRNLDTNFAPSGTGMTLTISRDALNADLHDGTWQCTPSNTAGSGTPATKTITVNAAPSLEPNGGLSGPYEVLINGSLPLMTCSFKAKPKADITWKYNGGTSLPDGVGQTSSDDPQGKYRITTGGLRWQGTDAVRKASGGHYICEANNGVGQSVQSGPATLLPLYGPDAASLTPAGPLIINEPNMTTITCQADCSKACSFSWTKQDNTTWSHTGASLGLSPSNRADHGIFVCKAKNNQGRKHAQIQISVNFPSTIKRFESSHQGDLISSNSTTLTCEVESKPEAYIQLVHVDSGTELEKINSGLSVQHTLNDVKCFDGGIYQCISHNSISSNDVTKDVTLDVKCPPSITVNMPNNIGEALNSSFTHRIPVVANPVLLKNDVQWVFQPNSNKLRRDNLPDNVETSISSTPHHLVKNLTIHIEMVSESNFGTYTVTATNQFGIFSTQVNLVPEGPPEKPSAPRLIKATAVSLLIEWTAGFNGGLDQRFSVIYKQSGATTDQSVEVPVTPGVSSGALVRYKLQENRFILADTTYRVRVMSVNDFDADDKKFSDETMFTTKAKPLFPENENPTVEFQTGSIIIELKIMNPDSVSHLVIVVCSDESQTQCGIPQNVTDLSVGQVVVPLPSVSVKEYHIEIVMYDGEDEVNRQTWPQKVPNNGLSGGAIAGIVVAFILVGVIIAAGFILHRKGKLPKMLMRGSDKERALVGSRRANKGFNNLALADVSNEYVDDIPYEDTRRAGIPVAKFPTYVDQMLGDPKNFEEEYERLPQSKLFEWKDADRHSNFRDKNRFRNIMPYDKNRVKLSVLQDDPLSDYINASYIKGFTLKDKLIATIGPIPATIVDFWRMIWEKQVPLIVMLTNCEEIGGKKKCAQYWPLEMRAGSVTHGTFTITTTKEDIWPDYTIRSLTVMRKGESMRVAHCHFTAWQDHHVPTCGTSLLAFRRIVSKKMIPDRYTVIHCSAGVGRTGTLIGLDYLIKQAEKEQHLDVFCCVEEMRNERVQMVQTARQYVFLHKALAQYFTTGPTPIDCNDFNDTYLKLTKPAKSSPNRITRQLEMLDKLSPRIHEADKDNAFMGTNSDKNSDRAVIPLLSSRVILKCYTPGSSDYINAVSVHGCKQMKAFLVTQLPLENTVTDFWRLMMDNTSSTVILLVTDQQYKDMPAFIPTTDNPSIESNNHLMTLTESIRNPGYTVNKIEMGPAPTQDKLYMNYADISKKPAVPPPRTRPLKAFVVHLAVNKQDIDPVCTLRVITEMKKWTDSFPNKPTTAVCWDGATYSGQFVACCNLVEMMSAEQEVDVFTIVKQIRDRQPMFVSNMVQYRGLHEVIKQYLEQSSLYANL